MHLLESIIEFIPFVKVGDPYPELSVSDLRRKIHYELKEYERTSDDNHLESAQNYLVSLSTRRGSDAKKIYKHYDRRIEDLKEGS
ncbi:hypothetical protein J4477_01150 [Candidatus Pacearchaeota archaeon]|nr:hypothetical protein [Candidatus Pacearchaeota archaeon]